MLKQIFILFIGFSLIIPPAPVSSETIQPVSGTLYTKDNIAISYDHYKKGSDSIIIVCPGFFNGKQNRWMCKTVDLLLAGYDVIIFDFRGHGKSRGKYTWSAKEDLDIDAVADYAAAQKYKHIGVLAFSLGAASAIVAVSKRDDIGSMVLISCPTRFQDIDFHFWEPGMFLDLKDNIDSKWDGKGARAENIFMKKEAPIDAIHNIKKTSIFFIHGDNDWVIKASHSKKLYDAAAVKKKLEIIKDGFHAERLIQLHYDKMRELILNWFSETLK